MTLWGEPDNKDRVIQILQRYGVTGKEPPKKLLAAAGGGSAGGASSSTVTVSVSRVLVIPMSQHVERI